MAFFKLTVKHPPGDGQINFEIHWIGEEGGRVVFGSGH